MADKNDKFIKIINHITETTKNTQDLILELIGSFKKEIKDEITSFENDVHGKVVKIEKKLYSELGNIEDQLKQLNAFNYKINEIEFSLKERKNEIDELFMLYREHQKEHDNNMKEEIKEIKDIPGKIKESIEEKAKKKAEKNFYKKLIKTVILWISGVSGLFFTLLFTGIFKKIISILIIVYSKIKG